MGNMTFWKTLLFFTIAFRQTIATAPSQVCGGRLTAETGVISTPNYPNTYPYENTCKWVIEAPVGHVVELSFVDFDVEEFDGECDTDEVHVRDSEDESGPLLIGKILCGNTVPEVTTSSSRYMFIYFSSDYMSMGGRGFNATYITKPAGKASCLSNACGGTFENMPSCEMQSPGYPLGYTANLNCSWLIKAPKTSDKISLTFNVLDFYNVNSRCSRNRVTLYDGNSADAPVIYEPLCDMEDNRVTNKVLKSTGPHMYVKLHTSAASTDNQGFAAKFNIISDEPNTESSTLPSSSVSTTSLKKSTSTVSTSTISTTTISTTAVKTTSRKRQQTTPSQKLAAEAAAVTSTVVKTTQQKDGNPLVDNPAALSGLVIGVIVAGVLIILAILLAAAYVHWKRQNKRFSLRFREEDARSDVNTLLSSTDSREFENNKKQNGKIVITAETELMC